MRGAPEAGSEAAAEIGMQVVDACALDSQLSSLAP